VRESLQPWFAKIIGPASAPAVVLLHAIATHGDMWAPQLAVWSQYYRLLIPDFPGHGNSPAERGTRSLDDYADRLLDCINRAGLNNVALVGLSFGGMVAQAFALRHPAELRALVIADSLAKVSPEAIGIWEERKKAAETRGMAAQVRATLERWFTPNFAARSPMILNWVGNMVESAQVRGYVAAITAIQELNFQERLPRINSPCLVVTGDSDSIVPPSVANATAAAIPGSETLIIEDAAHLSNVERSESFTEGVGAFLGKHLTQPTTSRAVSP